MASQGTLNKVMLIGHTGDDVKMHYFEGGGCVGNFPLATNESYVNRTTGERVTNTEWHNIVVRNKAAEICEKYLKKGDKVYIEGRIKTRKWQDDSGADRYITEIQCTDFTFLTPKDQGDNMADSPKTTGQNKASRPSSSQQNQHSGKVDESQTNQNFDEMEGEDDLPF